MNLSSFCLFDFNFSSGFPCANVTPYNIARTDNPRSYLLPCADERRLIPTYMYLFFVGRKIGLITFRGGAKLSYSPTSPLQTTYSILDSQSHHADSLYPVYTK